MVHGFDAAVGRPNQHQFKSEPVLAADDFLFFFVVVGGRAQMAENQFGNPDLVLGMLRHVDSVAVVAHDNLTLWTEFHADIDTGHRQDILFSFLNRLRHAHHMVATIHNAFVKQFEQPRYKRDALFNDGRNGSCGCSCCATIFIFSFFLVFGFGRRTGIFVAFVPLIFFVDFVDFVNFVFNCCIHFFGNLGMKYPLHHFHFFDRTNVRVGIFQNVFPIRHLLVLLF